MSPLQRQNDSTMSLDSRDSFSSTVSANEERKTKISFSTVEVREYERVVGDHPDVKAGPPLAIGWNYEQRESMNIDDYEGSRDKKNNLRLTSVTRRNMLINVFGFSEEEIRKAEEQVQRVQQQRRSTRRQGKTSERTEIVMESAKRKIKRRFSREQFWNGVSKTSVMMFPLGMAHA